MTSKKDALLTRKQAGIILIILGSFLIAFIILFLYFKAIRVQGLSEIFPENDTVLLLEINREPGSASFDRFAAWLKTLPALQESLWLPIITEKNEWLEHIGLAYLRVPGENALLLPAISGRISNRTAALQTLNTLETPEVSFLEQTYEGFPLYEKPNFYLTFIGDFFLVSPNKRTVELVLDAQKIGTMHLINNESYRAVTGTLPFFGTATISFVPETFTEIISSHFDFDQDPFAPILAEIIASYERGATLLQVEPAPRAENPARGARFFLHSTLKPKPALRAIQEQNPLRGKYHAALLHRFPQNPAFLLGGADLQTQWKRWRAVSASWRTTFTSIFSRSIDIEKELISFIQNEYTLAAYKDEEKTHYLFATEITDKESAETQLQQFVESFETLAPFINPEIREVTLPSGVRGRELVANPDSSERVSEIVNGVQISGVNLKENSWGFFGAVHDNMLLAATDLDLLKKSLALPREQSFRHSEGYKNNMSEVLSASDTVTFVNSAPFPTFVSATRQSGGLTYVTTLLSQ